MRVDARSPAMMSPRVAATPLEVRGAQRYLNGLGQEPPLREDGILGPETRAAVQGFQREAGLEPTGDLDRTTVQKLTAASLENAAQAVIDEALSELEGQLRRSPQRSSGRRRAGEQTLTQAAPEAGERGELAEGGADAPGMAQSSTSVSASTSVGPRGTGLRMPLPFLSERLASLSFASAGGRPRLGPGVFPEVEAAGTSAAPASSVSGDGLRGVGQSQAELAPAEVQVQATGVAHAEATSHAEIGSHPPGLGSAPEGPGMLPPTLNLQDVPRFDLPNLGRGAFEHFFGRLPPEEESAAPGLRGGRLVQGALDRLSGRPRVAAHTGERLAAARDRFGRGDDALLLAVAARQSRNLAFSARRGSVSLQQLGLPQAQRTLREPAFFDGKVDDEGRIDQGQALDAYAGVLEARWRHFEEAIDERFGEEGHAMLDNLSDDARRAWIQLAISAPNGAEYEGPRKTYGRSFGLNTALGRLQARDGQKVDLNSILEADDFLDPFVRIRRARATATEAALFQQCLHR